ncbi:MAG: hypothetical protein Q9174_002338 [Haloplaca sp. 1 TL-2023]
MPGAAKNRAKKARQGGAGGSKKGTAGTSNQDTPDQGTSNQNVPEQGTSDEITSDQDMPASFDGPAERPGSSSGPPQQGSSRGRAPSNAPSNAPSQSARSSSRPPSAGGQAPHEQPFNARREEQILNKRIEWGGNAHGFYNNDGEIFCPILLNTYTSLTPLHPLCTSYIVMDDPINPFQPDTVPSNVESLIVPGPAAINPDGTLVLPSRQMTLDANSYRDKMPTTLMRRPGFGTAGKPIPLQLNSHRIATLPSEKFYQYDVSIGKAGDKRGLIQAVWGSEQLNQKLPGGRLDWLFDGNKLAWSKHNLDRELRWSIDLDLEHNRGMKPPQLAYSTVDIKDLPKGKRPENPHENTHMVYIRKSAAIDLSMIHAYLEGRCDFDNSVIAAINFLDHLIRENPSRKHINIKKSYFSRTGAAYQDLTGGIEAIRGIYQSIRMAEGKRLVLNVDVSHTTFWRKSMFHSIVNLLSGLVNLDQLQHQWRDKPSDPNSTNNKFRTMLRLRKNKFIVEHRGRSAIESSKIHTVGDIMNMRASEYRFKPYMKEEKKEGAEISLPQYYYKKYGIYLNFPDLPLIKTTAKKPTYFPMEICAMIPGQRYPYKLNENQTREMLSFSATAPPKRLAGIEEGTAMLAWDQDPYLQKYGLKIESKPIVSKARVLEPPVIQMGGGGPNSQIKPGTKGRWNLMGKRFLTKNSAPLTYWGVCIMGDKSSPCKEVHVQAFVRSFCEVYKAHGGEVANTSPLIRGPFPDPAKGVEETFTAVGNHHQVRPQFLLFVVQNKDAENYLRIKKSSDCRYGVATQVVQGAQVMKNNGQYHSNVCMKVNAKLGGSTYRVLNSLNLKKDGSYFSVPTMVIGADVSHAAPGIGAPSYAAMTVSMDRWASRYSAGVQTNGHRVEIISTRNLRDMLKPLFMHWMNTVSSGNLPAHVYYFRDGVSEGQYINVLKQEVADIKEIFKELGETRKDFEVKFTVVVAEKRHHIRFFPGRAGDENQNPLPGTIVDRDVTHPFENDIYLCSHKALKGTARPTHYHMLMDEAGIKPDVFQKILYDHCYQYMRSTTPVGLFPAVYYAHLASNRARAHENITETARKLRDSGPTKSTSEIPAEEAKPLLEMINRCGLAFGMWYI